MSTILTPPYALPMSLEEARLQIKSDGTEDDELTLGGVRSARDAAEHTTRHILVATRLQQQLCAFPANGCAIKLERRPVLELLAVQYVDSAGATQSLTVADLQVVNDGEFTLVAPAPGSSWPSTRAQLAAVTLTYLAGHAAPISADTAANTITPRGWKALAVNDVVRFSNSGGALPAPLQAETDYHVLTVSGAGACTLAATQGGTEIDITTTGTGQSYLGEVPAAIKSWMRLRLGALDQHREEAAVKLEPLPYIDRLLDPFRAYGF